jgi:hypothetical protein
VDRQIVYIGQIPQDVDQLKQNKNTMIGLGYALQAILGTSTLVDGLPCAPTAPASLSVTVGPGSIYSQQNVDGTAYGSLNADTADQIVKQGIIMSTQTFSCPAPGTSGQSVVYLVEVAYEDVDGGSVVLPYYNASNPSSAYNGPNNTGVSQNTVRQGVCLVQVKTGVAATTGTQVTPTPDAGFTGLYAITVANGQSTITSGNIVQLTTAPFINPKLGGFLAAIQNGTGVYVADTNGAANTITIAPSPAFASLGAGASVRVKVANTNTGATVMNTNGLGNVSVKNPDSTALGSGSLVANGIYTFVYDGTNWELQTAPSNTQTFWAGTSTGSANAQVLTTGKSLASLTAGQVFRFTCGFNNSADTTFAIDSVAAIHAKVNAPTGPQVLQGGELLFNDDYELLWDGTSLILINPPTRQRLNAALNLYVATTGSDANQGLTSGNPFLTIQHAINYVANNLDLCGQNVTINVADGTYTGAVSVNAPWVGSGTVTLLGDTTTPANCIISTTSANCISVNGFGSTLTIEGFKLQTTTSGHAISCTQGGSCFTTGNMNFGSVSGVNFAHLNVLNNGLIQITANYTISGGAAYHISITTGGQIILAAGLTVTLTGTPAFANQFVGVIGLGYVQIYSITFSGSATGTRYSVTLNGVIYTNSGGATYLPGNASGSTATGGQYA